MGNPLTIPTRALGRTGLEVSVLGHGAEPLGRRGRSYADAARTLNAVLDLGVSLIDTAAAYGNSEAFIGRALAQRRGEFTLVTKCGHTGDYQPAWSPPEIAATIDQSLRNLQRDSLDVLLLHGADLEALRRGEVIAAIEQARAQGKARFLGYSGDNEALRYAVESGRFDVIECTFNILDRANGRAIAEAARRGLGVIIKRPIANAVPGVSARPRSDYAAQYWPRWRRFRTALEQLPADARRHLPSCENENAEIAWRETAVRFAAYAPGISAILIGSSHAEHMAANAEAIARGPLPSESLAALDAAHAAASGGDDWPALG